MYKVFTSLWSSTSTTTHKTRLSSMNSSDLSVDEDGWVLVPDAVSISKVTTSPESSMMNGSWIASPPLVNSDGLSSNICSSILSSNTHRFNPIENLLIEHASMSVYEQIASRTRARRRRTITTDDNKLDEQVEEQQQEEEDDDYDDDDDDRASVVLQYPPQRHHSISTHRRHIHGSSSQSTSSSITTLESSTSSLAAHQRHLHRLHQRRRRHKGTSSKLMMISGGGDDQKQAFNKITERQRHACPRTPKLVLHQPPRSNH